MSDEHEQDIERFSEISERAIRCYSRALELIKEGKSDEADAARAEGDKLQEEARQVLKQIKGRK